MIEIKDQRAIEGDSVKFECQFSGTPMPGIKQTLKMSPSPIYQQCALQEIEEKTRNKKILSKRCAHCKYLSLSFDFTIFHKSICLQIYYGITITSLLKVMTA